MGLSALDKLEKKWAEKKYVCIGLDPDISKLPSSVKSKSISDSLFKFNKEIIDATADLVCAYKPQISFYEAAGLEGWKALEKIVTYIKSKYPDICIILDAKRADIGSTNQGYVSAYFDELGVDAVTVHPYLGKEAVEPFLKRKDKLIIVLSRTSNPGAGEFQDLKVSGKPLYQVVAKDVSKKWNSTKNCAVVVGATYPKELKVVRSIIGDMPILIPGVGAQGGDVEASVKNGINKRGGGIIISSSRAIIYASTGEDFAKAARAATIDLHSQILKSLGIAYRAPLSQDQGNLADLFISTKTEAKVLRRKGTKGRWEFYNIVRKTSPIDFPANSEEFAIKVHQVNPDAPLSPIYLNLRNLPQSLITKIGKVLSQVRLDRKYDYCSGIPNTATAFAKEYSKFSKIPYIDLFDKVGTATDRKLVPLKGAPKGRGKSVLIIDDVISQGYSKFEVIEVAEKLGYKTGFLVLVDRSQGGAEVLAKRGYTLLSAMNIFSIVEYYFKTKKISKTQYENVLSYFGKQS